MKQCFFYLLIIFSCIHINAQENQVDQPIENFENLWAVFNSRYANFELKNVDWKKMYDEYRPQVNEQTNNGQLFEICCSMLQELNDGHVSIEPFFESSEKECGPPYIFTLEEEFKEEKDWLKFKENMESTFTNFGFSKAISINVSQETNFQYRTSEKYAYLRIDEMTENFFLRKLKKALNQSMDAFESKKGLIIDLRFNGGGYDRAAYQIAGRLVKNKKVGHYKKKRIKNTNRFSKSKTIHLKPKGKTQFTNPIIILTSDITASAAEVFLLALKDLPNVTIVGDTTEGIFSDMYEFKLPNKWKASLSHWQFFSSNMINYEGKGIQPDHEIINIRDDLKSGIDPVITKAIEILNQ